jgi:hypothetical protein
MRPLIRPSSAPCDTPGRLAVCDGIQQQRLTGNPDAAHISTSYIERQSLTIRMSVRRFTRLTNAFSMKADTDKAAHAPYVMHYNLARIHKVVCNAGHGGRRVASRVVAGGDCRAGRIAAIR